LTILSVTAESTFSQRVKRTAQKKSAWQQNLDYPFQEHQELAGVHHAEYRTG
jgi:hypothetical protein